ncbi:MAG TPA: HAMP domain-containing sensor histidine kinase [Streptosporangiaceae bacterium]|nr:HAMP domain-containing sensor histidine kinase [Streptosporangiaceae bacterium]
MYLRRLVSLAASPRLPRRTVRLRLTLLYGGLFLLSGAALLAVTYVLVVQATSGVIFKGQNGSQVAISGSHRGPAPSGGGQPPALRTSGGGSGGLSARQLQAQARKLQAQASRQHEAELHQLLIQSGLALAGMAVLSIGLGWVVAGRVLRPLRTITAAAREISATSLHERLALGGPDDELKELGDTFDGLLARLDASFSAQRQFVANASHELRTPLARQRVLSQVALADPDASAEILRAAHERVLAAGAEQEQLIEALLTLARGQAGLGTRLPFDLAEIAGQVLGARRPAAELRGLDVHAALSVAPAAGDPRLAERLAANLVDNALNHNVADGHVDVATGIRNGQAILSVTNSGPVVPAAQVDRLLQPFQRHGAGRTGHRKGLGLGLSIVQAIATAHGGTLAIHPRPAGGLRVEVTFPAPGRGAQASHFQHSDTRPPARRDGKPGKGDVDGQPADRR